MATAEIDVFHYLDYRVFLADRYEVEKQRSRVFSHRYFSNRIGVKSPSHLKRVMNGERKLTREMTGKYAKAFSLAPEETGYFRALVSFNDATTSADREEAYVALSSFRKYREVHQLDIAQREYCAHWYVPAIRELVCCEGFREDPEWIASQLRPRISVKEARSALKTLFEIGLLVRDDEGVVQQKDANVSTGAQTDWVHVTRYHRAMLEQASRSIDEFPAKERDLSAVALAVPEASLAKLKARLDGFRKELLAEFSTDSDASRVVQINLQMFPLSGGPETEKS